MAWGLARQHPLFWKTGECPACHAPSPDSGTVTAPREIIHEVEDLGIEVLDEESEDEGIAIEP